MPIPVPSRSVRPAGSQQSCSNTSLAGTAGNGVAGTRLSRSVREVSLGAPFAATGSGVVTGCRVTGSPPADSAWAPLIGSMLRLGHALGADAAAT